MAWSTPETKLKHWARVSVAAILTRYDRYDRMNTTSVGSRRASLRGIFAYMTGDGVNSLIMNSIFGYSMLYYTEALGLDYKLAGLAMSVATLWDAITDPLMGHITDNTRSRFGRRHPYMLLGGVLATLCYYFIWAVPPSFQAPHLLFWYLVVVNLLLRTGITVFAVSHGALGFEISTDYTQRTTLQGMRWGFNMLVNLAGPALAWRLFFPDRDDGVEATSVADNFVRMGSVFAIAALVFTLFVVFATRKYIVDTRNTPGVSGSSPLDFLKNFAQIITDKIPRTVFIFNAIALYGVVLVSALQMYVYVHFMKFSSTHKAIVHGSTMVACGLGGLASPLMVKWFDKKPSICIAVIVSVSANGMLLLLFVTGWIPAGASFALPDTVPIIGGTIIPHAMLIFLVFHATFWAGVGTTCAIANSMMADVSEICKHRTGVLKDGGYSAMLSFIIKTSMSLGLLTSGYCLAWVGFDVESEVQTPEAIRGLGLVTFAAGSAIALIALFAIRRYPVTREYMERIKSELAAKSNASEPIPGAYAPGY